jgi:hypothetical protein
MGSAHDSGSIAAFEHLHLANSAASLPATDWNSAFETDLRAAQDSLIIRTRQHFGRAFYPNLKFHSASHTARWIPHPIVEIAFVDWSADSLEKPIPAIQR